MASQTDLPPHVRRLVDEIESEIGESDVAADDIEGETGRPDAADDNGRVEDAVRKMTSLNAAKIGVHDRGLLRPGNFADITVFDAERVIDKATYVEPFQYNVGIEFVIVNGQVVLDRDKHTGSLPGRALRLNQ